MRAPSSNVHRQHLYDLRKECVPIVNCSRVFNSAFYFAAVSDGSPAKYGPIRRQYEVCVLDGATNKRSDWSIEVYQVVRIGNHALNYVHTIYGLISLITKLYTDVPISISIMWKEC